MFAKDDGWFEECDLGTGVRTAELTVGSWYTTFLAGVEMVIDLEAGSGAAATAAVDAGILYSGIAKNDGHMGWVTNILDRYALSLMVKKGHRLYNETLKDAVRELFGDAFGFASESTSKTGSFKLWGERFLLDLAHLENPEALHKGIGGLRMFISRLNYLN